MAFQNKELRVGDLIESDIGEVYLYLGYFEGVPYSYYTVPDCGHMYIFCETMHSLEFGISYDASMHDAIRALNASGIILSPQLSAVIAQRNWSRLQSSFDGNGRYTKAYAKFKRLVGHVDIPNKEQSLSWVYGCRRLGDKKPKGYKG